MEEYANAFKEVQELLKITDEKTKSKIPNQIQEIIAKNASENYNFVFNPKMEIEKQLSEKAKQVIALLFHDYIAKDEEKINMIKQEEKNDLHFEGIEKFDKKSMEKEEKKEETKEITIYKKTKWYHIILKFFHII